MLVTGYRVSGLHEELVDHDELEGHAAPSGTDSDAEPPPPELINSGHRFDEVRCCLPDTQHDFLLTIYIDRQLAL